MNKKIESDFIALQTWLALSLDTVIWRSSARILEILLDENHLKKDNHFISGDSLKDFWWLLIGPKNIESERKIILLSQWEMIEEGRNQQLSSLWQDEFLEQVNYSLVKLNWKITYENAIRLVKNLQFDTKIGDIETENRLFYRLKKIDLNLTGRTR